MRAPVLPVPCSKRFEDLHGTGPERHCDTCDLKVVDLSVLGDAEIYQALRSGRCVSFLRAEDGSLVRSNRRPLPIAGALAIAALAACSAPVRYSGAAPPTDPAPVEVDADAGAADASTPPR
jgi:hypothetical protein